MIEKVNPQHPDKVADRIAGAIVDLAYAKEETPKIAVEVLIGHGGCTIIAESSVFITHKEAEQIVERIAGITRVGFILVAQDAHLANNQVGRIRGGDNGIFKGVPLTAEEIAMAQIARDIYKEYPCDGKYILNGDRLIICQSNAKTEDIAKKYPTATINPLGDWTGGTDVDTGATNRKLGSDMAQSVTGGGLHGKDLSKADVSVNIYCHLLAQETGKVVTACCAIGDETVNILVGNEPRRIPYADIVSSAGAYIRSVGGFERFAEWGLV